MRSTVTNTLADLLRDEHGTDYARCESPSLRLEKFVHIGDNTKKSEIDAVVACHRAHAKPIPFFEPKGTESFVAKLRSRLIVNQAGGILENAGLCLHPHFGAPYIPGSAVKGIARHAAWCEWNEETDETKKAEIANLIAQVFGYPTGDKEDKDDKERVYLDAYLADRGWKDKSTSGTVAFLPATPIDSGRLVTDIVNSHHPQYYAGNQPTATDDESPVLLPFPAVDEGVQFLFSFVPIRPGSNVSAAKKWLIKALSENGAGAKTAAGYGWFDCDAKWTEFWRKAIEEEKGRCLREQRKAAFVNRLETFKAMPEEDLKTHASEVRGLTKELEDFKDTTFYNQHIATVNALIARLPKQSPLDALRANWEASRDNLNPVIGNNVASFTTLPEDKKALICQLLWEASGIGAEIRAILKDEAKWQGLNKNQKSRRRDGIGEIRKYAKNTLNLGKMP